MLASKRFIEGEEEEALLNVLASAGLGNPSLSFLPWCSALPQGLDATAYFADLRDRLSYIANGPSNYEERRGATNRKALEGRFPEKQAAGLSLAII